jgi:hypothetical protein
LFLVRIVGATIFIDIDFQSLDHQIQNIKTHNQKANPDCAKNKSSISFMKKGVRANELHGK